MEAKGVAPDRPAVEAEPKHQAIKTLARAWEPVLPAYIPTGRCAITGRSMLREPDGTVTPATMHNQHGTGAATLQDALGAICEPMN